MGRSGEQFKEMSVREFTQAARVYESEHAGIYKICKDDYPQLVDELEAQKGFRAHLVARKPLG